MPKMAFVVAFLVTLAGLAAAQNASIGESVISRGQAPVMDSSFHSVQPPKAPSYCKPCLWYSGDFDPNNPYATSLQNEHDQHADSHSRTSTKLWEHLGVVCSIRRGQARGG